LVAGRDWRGDVAEAEGSHNRRWLEAGLRGIGTTDAGRPGRWGCGRGFAQRTVAGWDDGTRLAINCCLAPCSSGPAMVDARGDGGADEAEDSQN